jgi:hypothetical protein
MILRQRPVIWGQGREVKMLVVGKRGKQMGFGKKARKGLREPISVTMTLINPRCAI